MKRLTVADEKHSDGRMVFHQVGYIPSDMAHDLYYALKEYEDTGYGPEVFQRLNGPETPLEIALDAEVHKLRMENARLTDELKMRKLAVMVTHETQKTNQMLFGKIARLTAERDAEKRRADAAVRDLREYAPFAATCEKYEVHRCGYQCQGPRCPGWEWRGPCAENTEAPTGTESEVNHED